MTVVGEVSKGAPFALALKRLGLNVFMVNRPCKWSRVVKRSERIVSWFGGDRPADDFGLRDDLMSHGVPFLQDVSNLDVRVNGSGFDIQASGWHGSKFFSSTHVVLASGVDRPMDAFEALPGVLVGMEAVKNAVASGSLDLKRVGMLGERERWPDAMEIVLSGGAKSVHVFADGSSPEKSFGSFSVVNASEGCSVFLPASGSTLYHASVNDDPYSRYAFDTLVVMPDVSSLRVLPVEVDPVRGLKDEVVRLNHKTSQPGVFVLGCESESLTLMDELESLQQACMGATP